jgi:DNA polymerase/3'-5' exonuclease PolX
MPIRRLPLKPISASGGLTYFALVSSHQMTLRKNVSFHCSPECFPSRSRRDLELAAECVEAEEVAMRFAGRRARATITGAAESIAALYGAGLLKRFSVRHCLRQIRNYRRQIEENPMCGDSGRRIRVFTDNREALRILRNSSPAHWQVIRGTHLAAQGILGWKEEMNEEIAEIFDRMSRVLAFKGKDRFRTLAYERAASSLRSLDQDLEDLARAGKLEEIQGIGHDLSQLIEEYIQTGRITRCEQESRGVPNELISLMDIPGLGPKTLALLHQKYRVKNIEDLKRLITDGKLKKLQGFGEKKIENLRRGIALWQSSKQRMPLGLALPPAENLIDVVRKIPQVERADLAGSIRRRHETIGGIDMLIISRDSRAALREFVRLPEIKQVIARGETRATVIIEGGMQVDVRAVPQSLMAPPFNTSLAQKSTACICVRWL